MQGTVEPIIIRRTIIFEVNYLGLVSAYKISLGADLVYLHICLVFGWVASLICSLLESFPLSVHTLHQLH